MKNETPKVRFFGIGKVLPFLAVHKKLYITMLLSVLPVMAINTVLPLFQRYAIHNFIANKTLDGFAVFVTLYAALILISCVVDFISSYSCSKIEMYLLRDMRRSAFNHLQTLSVSYYNTTGVGKIHARVMSDTSSIGSVIAAHCMRKPRSLRALFFITIVYPPPFRVSRIGISSFTSVPPSSLELMDSTAPTSSARLFMPEMPNVRLAFAVPGEKPVPSSVTNSETFSSVVLTMSEHSEGRACLAAFCNASCTMR